MSLHPDIVAFLESTPRDMTDAVALGSWEPGSDEWHAARATGIGGSEVAPILGISPFESRFSLWHRKAGQIGAVDESPEMEWGKRHEPTILAKYRDNHPGTRLESNVTYAHQTRPWQIANPDMFGDRVVEAKCSRDSIGWGDPGTDQIPAHYRCQVLWYMDVLGATEADIAVMIGLYDYREYTVTYNATEAEWLRTEARAFLDTIERNERPAIDGHDATFQAIRELHPDIDGTDVALDEDTVARYVTSRARLAEAKAVENHAKSTIADLMGSAQRAMWDDRVIARRQARKDGTPYVVAGRDLPDPDWFTPFTNHQETTP